MKQYTVEQRAELLKKASTPNSVDWSQAPKFVQDTVLEALERRAAGENVEHRTWTFAPVARRVFEKVVTAVRSVAAPNSIDAQNRARCANNEKLLLADECLIRRAERAERKEQETALASSKEDLAVRQKYQPRMF